MTDWTDLTPTRHGQAWVRRGSEEVAVFNPDDGQLHRLNPSAFAIWELCDGQTTAREVANAILEVAGLSPERAHRDVNNALNELRARGLVV